MPRPFNPINAAFLVFCLFMAIVYGQAIYQTKFEGGFAFTNALFFISGILGLISLVRTSFAKLSILVSSALFFLMSVYAFGVIIVSIGPIEGTAEIYSPSIGELLIILAIGALSGLTFLANFALDTSQDSAIHAEGK